MTMARTIHPVAECELRAARASVVLARMFVAATVQEWGVTECEEAALAVVSELVTNAVEVTAQGAFVRVRLSRREDGLWLKVLDGAERREPVVRETVTCVEDVDAAEGDAFGGWGLQLVRHHAERVWTERAAEQGCKWVCAVIGLAARE
ncbi:ATP-binding protein [Actinomadura sp. 21ATH]|uniref:ATP-binding protein n=1 Tax=Actinomadura sp. 21ATH TaxID=1735444 RepID=UPI0035BEFFE0